MIRDQISNAESYRYPEQRIRADNTEQTTTRSNGKPVRELLAEILGYDIPESQRISEREQELLESFRRLNESNLALAEMQEQSAYSFEDAPDLDALAEAQGVTPVHDIDELVADFWPEDESIEEFIATVREWRREGHAPNS